MKSLLVKEELAIKALYFTTLLSVTFMIGFSSIKVYFLNYMHSIFYNSYWVFLCNKVIIAIFPEISGNSEGC
jgi:hypothetical protein